MEFKARSKLKLLNTGFKAEEYIAKQREDTQSQLNQYDFNQILTSQDLEMKTLAILSRTNNSPEIEQDFRWTCAFFENQKSTSNSQLNEAYQKYVSAYHKIASIYILNWDNNQYAYLHIFDIENEVEERRKIEDLEPLNPWQNTNDICMCLLPNFELFFFGIWKNPGFTFMLNTDYEVQVLPPGDPCGSTSAIYFNRKVYCFGAMKDNKICAFSSKYDLDENRWIKLAEMPIKDCWCSSVIFNDNILISGTGNRNLMLYSIDIDSFSVIPYNFLNYTKKLLINVEKMYVIECRSDGSIYENEAGDVYEWNKIAKSVTCMPYRTNCLYNKGNIYIITDNDGMDYYKFDLDKKILKVETWL